MVVKVIVLLPARSALPVILSRSRGEPRHDTPRENRVATSAQRTFNECGGFLLRSEVSNANEVDGSRSASRQRSRYRFCGLASEVCSISLSEFLTQDPGSAPRPGRAHSSIGRARVLSEFRTAPARVAAWTVLRAAVSIRTSKPRMNVCDGDVALTAIRHRVDRQPLF